MSELSKGHGEPPPPSYASETAPVHGILAEFDDVTPLTRACEKVRDAGFVHWDAHTPFAVHGLDAAMGVKPTRLPWLVLGGGITGMGLGLLMQCWMNGIDYKFIISGKPLFSIPAFVPVTFELTVLLSAFCTFFGALAFNNLPSLFHPLNLSRRFRRVTDDRFFVYIEAKDPAFEAGRVEKLLQSCDPLSLETVRYAADGQHMRLPRGTTGVAAILAVVSLVPFVIAARARERTSTSPRIHLNPPAPVKDDMDQQYKFGAQATNWFFADNRAARHWPAGTVAVEDAVEQTPFLTGKAVAVAPPPPAPAIQGSNSKRNHPRGNNEALEPPSVPAAAPEAAFVTSIPKEVLLTETTLKRGQQRFNIYCATCHGIAGHGDGLVARHADALQEGTWVSPSDLHEARVRGLAVGDLYNSITHGVRNMPAYGHLIEPMDRWLIVAYVKALQLSLHAKSDEIPDELRRNLQ